MDNELKAQLERRGEKRISRTEFKAKEQAQAQMLQRIWKYESRKEKKMTEFAKGVKVKTVKTQYGEIIKIGVNLEEFSNNPINDDGWINFDILTSKSGKKYTAIDTYRQKSKDANNEIDTDVIPF